MEKLGENRGFNQLGKQKQITSQPSLLWITQYDSSVVSLPTKGYANVCYVSWPLKWMVGWSRNGLPLRWIIDLAKMTIVFLVFFLATSTSRERKVVANIPFSDIFRQRPATAFAKSWRRFLSPCAFGLCWVVLLGCKIKKNASLMGWFIIGFCTFYNTWVCIYIYICACIFLHFHLTRLCERDVLIYKPVYVYIYIHCISLYIAGLTIVSCLDTRKSSKKYQIYHGNINRIKLIWEKHHPHPKRW